MRLQYLLAAALAVLPAASTSLTPSQEAEEDPIKAISSFKPADKVARLAFRGLEEIKFIEESRIPSRSPPCSLKDVTIRRDWYVQLTS